MGGHQQEGSCRRPPVALSEGPGHGHHGQAEGSWGVMPPPPLLPQLLLIPTTGGTSQKPEGKG